MILKRRKKEYYNEVKEYQLFQYNSLTNKSSLGIVTIPPERIFENGFLSYCEFDNQHVLISDFGQSEFVCTGTCYCEDKEYTSEETDRRRTTTILSRGLTYLVASISSIIALNIAKEYFEEECVIRLVESSCEPSTIRSEVDECVNVHSLKTGESSLFGDFEKKLQEQIKQEKYEETLKEMKKERETVKRDIEMRQARIREEYEKNKNDQLSKYLCKGSCVLNTKATRESTKIEDEMKKRKMNEKDYVPYPFATIKEALKEFQPAKRFLSGMSTKCKKLKLEAEIHNKDREYVFDKFDLDEIGRENEAEDLKDFIEEEKDSNDLDESKFSKKAGKEKKITKKDMKRTDKWLSEFAERKFRDLHLRPFCEENSPKVKKSEVNRYIDEEMTGSKIKRNKIWCTHTNVNSEVKSNVKCRKI